MIHIVILYDGYFTHVSETLSISKIFHCDSMEHAERVVKQYKENYGDNYKYAIIILK